MLDGLVRTSLRLRLLVAAFAGALLIGGVFVLRDASVDVLPEFTPPYVEIQTEALGLSAAEVEDFITVPLEANLLSGVAWVESISSKSVPGLSSIVLTFEPGTDLLRARQVVQERLTQARDLPRVSKPPAMLQPLSSSSRVMMVGLSSEELSLIDLSVLARWNIRPRLMGVPGVANVAVWGQRERQLQVQVDPARLNEEGVTLRQVISTTGNALWVSPLSYLNASTPGAGGFIETDNQRLGVRHVLPITTAEDLAEVRVEGSPLTLGDVANVVEDHQPLIGDAHTPNGAGLLLVIERFPGADVPAVTAGVKDALSALAAGLEGVDIDTTVFQAATFVEMASANVGLALLIGLVLLVIVLLVFGFDWRRTLVTVVSSALAIVTGALVLHFTGATVNSVVVAGVLAAAAVVVSDAVLQVRAIQARIDQKRGRDARAAAVSEGTTLARDGSGFVLVIVLLALVPLFAFDGLAGALLPPMATAFALSLVASVVVGYVVTPALAVFLLRPNGGPERSGLVSRAEPAYGNLLSRIVPHLGIGAIATIAIAIVIAAALPFLRSDVVPEFAERDLVVGLGAAPGTAQPVTSRLVEEVRADLVALPGVRDVGGHVGRAIMSDHVANVDASELWVSLERDAPYEATVAGVRGVLDGYAGLRPTLQTYLGQQTAELAGDPEEQIVVRLFGPLPDVLEEQAAVVQAAIAGVPGVSDARIEPVIREPQIEVEVDLAAAAEHGLKPGDIRRAASTLVSGIEVGSLFEDQKVFDVVVWGVPELRSSLTSFRGLLIDTPAGDQVTLDQVADIRVDEAFSVINREAISRRLDVVASVGSSDSAGVARSIDARLAELPFPLEYHAEVIESGSAPRAARERALALGAAAFVGVLLLFQAAFSSWRLATLALVVPASAVAGGLVATLVTAGVISLGVIAGLLALLGISAGMAVRLVSEYRRVAQEAGGVPGHEQLVRRAQQQLGAVLLSSVPVVALLLPFAVLGRVPGIEIAQPLAIVLVAGVVVSSLVGALVLPALYRSTGSPARSRTASAPTEQLPEPEAASNV